MTAYGYGIAAVFPRIEAVCSLQVLVIGGILFLKRFTGFVRCHENDGAFVAGPGFLRLLQHLSARIGHRHKMMETESDSGLSPRLLTPTQD